MNQEVTRVDAKNLSETYYSIKKHMSSARFSGTLVTHKLDGFIWGSPDGGRSPYIV